MKLKLPSVTERADVREVRESARGEKVSIEMAARVLRHEFLARTARRLRIPTVALAHHADDQLELFFLRLLRGSGSEGLAGMKWRNPSPANPKVELVRPLLDLPKRALKEFAAENHIPFREDASNAALDIQRNRIRHELLPLLRKRYQPALDKTLPRVMDILAADAEFVTQAAETWLGSARLSGLKKLTSSVFEALPIAVQRRCIQLQLLHQGIAPDFEIVEYLRRNAGKSVNILGRGQLQAIRSGAGLVTLREPERLCPRGTSRLVEFRSGSGETVLDAVSFKWRIDAKNGLHRPKMRPGREFFDADRVGSPIFLRYWRPGDQFQPIGMPQNVKLQDFFTNLKVPREKRHELVLATTAAGDIFWVEGLRISERFKLAKTTIRRLQWEWLRL